MTKEFLIDRLKDMISAMTSTKDMGVRDHFKSKAEGFLEALYFTDLFEQEEFLDYLNKIDDAYWDR